MQTKSSRLRQVVRFCIAGLAGGIAYYTALYCLTEFLGVWYIASAAVGFVLNTGLNFTFRKFWAFQDKDLDVIHRQIMLYVTMSVSFIIVNSIFLYLMVQHLHMWYITAQMILTVVLTIVSFILCQKIFKAERSQHVQKTPWRR
jgi:putative flippase GtrA